MLLFLGFVLYNPIHASVSLNSSNFISIEAFFLDSFPPEAECQDVTVIADENCEGFVTAEQVDSSSYDPDGDSLYSIDPPGPYPLGETLVTLTVADSLGETDQCTAIITVLDTVAPTIIPNPNIYIMWPPNHQLTSFGLSDLVLSVDDNCSDLTVEDINITKVTCDEEVNTNGDGNTEGDIVIADDCSSVELRAERQGGSNGRVYTIYFELSDASDNVDSSFYQVYVPHNTGSETIDDGVVYEVYLECTGETTSIASIDSEDMEMSVYPNPFTELITFEFDLKQTTDIEIIIFNQLGNQVGVISDKQLQGLNKIEWTPNNLPEGIYYYKLKAGDLESSGKVMLMK